MPKYAKFLKELLSNKRKLEELSTMTLSKSCFAILQNNLPKRLKDPRSFTLPCLVGNLLVEKTLVDLGVNINLMPYELFKKLGLGEPKPTRKSIQSQLNILGALLRMCWLKLLNLFSQLILLFLK